MLRDRDREWIKHQRARYEEKTGIVRQRDLRIRKKALRIIQDLTFLAQELSEDQAAQVFNVENLRPLIDAILTSKHKEENKQMIVENERIFHLAVMLIRKGMSKGTDLMKSPYGALFLSTEPSTTYVRAVFMMDELLKMLKK